MHLVRVLPAFALVLASIPAHAGKAALPTHVIPLLARCPVDSSSCQEVAQIVEQEPLRTACEAKTTGACTTAAFQRAVTRRFPAPRLAAIQELTAACEAGEHSACELALEAALGSAPMAIGYQPEAIGGETAWPLLPARARIEAACESGDWRACDRLAPESLLGAKFAPLRDSGRRASCEAGSTLACDGLRDRADDALRTGVLQKACEHGQTRACLSLVANDPAQNGRKRALVATLPAKCRKRDAAACATLVENTPRPEFAPPSPALCTQLAAACASKACSAFDRSIETQCEAGPKSPPSPEWVYAREVRCVVFRDGAACGDAAAWHLRGLPSEAPDRTAAARLARRGCDREDHTACALRLDFGEAATTLGEELVTRCREKDDRSCGALFVAVEKTPKWFAPNSGLRALLDERCVAGDRPSCNTRIDVLEKGIGGPPDLAGAIAAAATGCASLGGGCDSNVTATVKELSRLRCLLLGDRCESAGLPLPRVQVSNECPGTWGGIAEGYLVCGAVFGFRVYDLSSGAPVGGLRRFPENLSFRAGHVATGRQGPAMLLTFDGRETNARGASEIVHLAWTPDEELVRVGAKPSWHFGEPIVVNATHRVAWVMRPASAVPNDAPGQLVMADLETGVVNIDGTYEPGVRLADMSEDSIRRAAVGLAGVYVGKGQYVRGRKVPTKLAPTGLDLSPSGERLALWQRVDNGAAAGTLEVWDVAKEPQLLWSAPAEDAAFTLDGSQLAIRQKATSSALVARLVDAETGRWMSPPVRDAEALIPGDEAVFVAGPNRQLGKTPKPGKPAWLTKLPTFESPKTDR